MRIKNFIYFAKWLLVCVQYIFVNAKPFVGVNVRRANEGEFNFIVSLKARGNENPEPEIDHLCTGSLISENDVITSSHGLQLLELNSFEIIVGSIDIRNGRKYYPAWWINYMQWTVRNNVTLQLQEYDIAIIRLTAAVPNTIIPVMLLPVQCDSLYGRNVTIAGWGETLTGNKNRYLETGEVTIMSDMECEDRMNELLRIIIYMPDNVLCSTANPFILSTPGDSGGPVLFMNFLVAIHKGSCPITIPGVHPSKMNVHTSISEFTDFIASIFEMQ